MSNESTEKSSLGIDLRSLLSDFLRSARRLLWFGVGSVLLFAVFFCGRAHLSYTPQYRATASFTVYVTNPLQAEVKTYNTATAEQMAKTFPYILTSGALSDVVTRELGIPAMPAVSASVLENTNIFTLSVTSGDPQLAYDVLNAVITCYPDIAEFVVGSTTMNLLDESGVPSEPVNRPGYGSALKKGALIGLALWAVLVLLIALSRSTIHNETELRKLLNLRCVGTLPVARGYRTGEDGENCPILTDEGDPFGFNDSVRLLAIRVEKELSEHQRQVLLVSSAIPGEGKTTVAANLAIGLAKKGKRTLLIDCDLRNPSSAAAFGQEDVPGMAAFLTGKAAADTITHRQKPENLYVVFGGPPAPNGAELLAKPETKYFIDAARSAFDYVILDTPPCSMLADASEVAELADCALYTIRQDYAAKARILEGAQLLAASGLPMIGCVMNCVKRGVWKNAYGYYGYGYGEYYGSYGDHVRQ